MRYPVSGDSSAINGTKPRCRYAKAAEVSNPYLSQVERGLRKPSAEILGRIAQGLRISAESLYVQAGILDEREGDEAVTTAIAADPTLTERQRTTLLQIYAAFQAENSSAGKPHNNEQAEEPAVPESKDAS